MEHDNEIERLVSELNAIQRKSFEYGSNDEEDRMAWKQLTSLVYNNGYVLRKRRIRSALGGVVGVVWRAVPKGEARTRATSYEADFMNVDMRPKDGLPTKKGDCTTRCMSYIFKGIFTYREIEHEQYRLAEEANRTGEGSRRVRRNTTAIWERILLDSGYGRHDLMRKVRRDRIAAILRHIDSPVATRSSGHVAVVEKGKVIDCWDSRGGFVKSVYIKDEDFEDALKAFKSAGVAVW